MKTSKLAATACILVAFSLSTGNLNAQVYQSTPQYQQPARGYQQYPQQTYPQQYRQYQQPTYQQPYRQGVIQQYPGQARPVVTSHWSSKLVPNKRVHDFGAVPSYSKQEYVFEIKNPFEHEVQFTSIRTSCGCTKPKILTQKVPAGGTGKILAAFDTKSHKGDRRATVSVIVRKDTPHTDFGEFQVEVKGSIRQDVVLNPGTISFGNITPGEQALRSVKVLYAGSPIWKITDIKSSNPNIKIERKEIRRDQFARRVDYELSVVLDPSQDLGLFKDQITIYTNDRKYQQMTVNVEGNVKPVVQVSPVRLGAVNQGTRISKRLIVNGSRPFSIRSIKVGDQRIKFQPASGSKTLHILNYTLDTDQVGMVSANIQIETDDPGQPQTSIPFNAQIVPATFADSDK